MLQPTIHSFSFKGFDPEWATQNTWGEATSTRTFLFGVKLAF